MINYKVTIKPIKSYKTKKSLLQFIDLINEYINITPIPHKVGLFVHIGLSEETYKSWKSANTNKEFRRAINDAQALMSKKRLDVLFARDKNGSALIWYFGVSDPNYRINPTSIEIDKTNSDKIVINFDNKGNNKIA